MEWPLGWMTSYNGNNCDLWRYVFRSCQKAELCHEAAELLPTIGYDLTKHKCFQS